MKYILAFITKKLRTIFNKKLIFTEILLTRKHHKNTIYNSTKKILMKTFFEKFYKLLTYKSDNFAYISDRIISRKSVRFLIWVRIISRIYMWLLALYLIAHFAVFIRRILIP